MFSCNDWWIVFDSEVPRFWLLNERGIALALLDCCGMIQTKRPIKSHHSSPFALVNFLIMIRPQSLELHSAKIVSGDGVPLILQSCILRGCRLLCLKALSTRAFALFVQLAIHQRVLIKGGSTFLDRKTLFMPALSLGGTEVQTVRRDALLTGTEA